MKISAIRKKKTEGETSFKVNTAEMSRAILRGNNLSLEKKKKKRPFHPLDLWNSVANSLQVKASVQQKVINYLFLFIFHTSRKDQVVVGHCDRK